MDKCLEKYNLPKQIQKKQEVWFILMLWKKLKQISYNPVILLME